jgi:hypothetical protein
MPRPDLIRYTFSGERSLKDAPPVSPPFSELAPVALSTPRKKERDADRLTDAAAQVPAVRAASASQLFNVQIQITEGPYPVG